VRRLLFALVPLLVPSLLSTSPARACAHAPPLGERAYTDREDAVIVWDAVRHMEHFVRSAVFNTAAKSLGFLVPTPSRPTLAEASDGIADLLGALTKPVETRETQLEPVPFGCTALPFLGMARSKMASEVALAPAGVQVLEETRVAGMDATVLAADDANALAAWLEARDFEFRDALKAWVAPYLAKKWIITAFRYVRPDIAANGPFAPASIASRAVRMSFATDAPVYPYREPEDRPVTGTRRLRLFVLSASRVEATLPDLGGKPWDARLDFAAKVPRPEGLAEALPGVDLPGELWLNELNDYATKRPGADLVLRAAASQAEVRRPPHVTYDTVRVVVPYELPFIVGGLLWWRRRKRRRAK
jgi:hypothetical protein